MEIDVDLVRTLGRHCKEGRKTAIDEIHSNSRQYINTKKEEYRDNTLEAQGREEAYNKMLSVFAAKGLLQFI